MVLYVTVYRLDDTVGANSILSEILKALVLLSSAVLSMKDANKKNSFTQIGFYRC